MRWAASLALVLTVAASCGSSSTERIVEPGASTTTSTTVEQGSTTSSPRQTSTTASRGTSTTVTTVAARSSGVRGRVTAGPTCPVERADQPCPPRPVTSTRIEAVSAGRVVGSGVTDADGRYAITLDPGDYTLHVAIDGSFPRCPDTDAQVPTGSPVTVDIACDTGIR